MATVQTSNDYGIFNTMEANRKVIPSHVKDIKESMKANPSLFESRPILVNENMFVIDGQHRLQAAKELGRPVHYTVARGITLDETRALNSTQRSWNMMDYALSYAASGKEAYKEFVTAVRKYPNVSPSSIRSILGGTFNADINRAFKDGGFTIEDTGMKYEYLAKISAITDKVAPVTMSKAMVSAFITLFSHPETYDFEYEQFMKKLEADGARIQYRTSATAKDALRNIEDVYNFQSRAPKRFY